MSCEYVKDPRDDSSTSLVAAIGIVVIVLSTTKYNETSDRMKTPIETIVHRQLCSKQTLLQSYEDFDLQRAPKSY